MFPPQLSPQQIAMLGGIHPHMQQFQLVCITYGPAKYHKVFKKHYFNVLYTFLFPGLSAHSTTTTAATVSEPEEVSSSCKTTARPAAGTA